MAEDESDENTFKILIATDIHVGYMEKDPIRGNDSIVTFEEILGIAKKNDVDFILLGGDLFHDNKPSRSSLHGVMTLIRKYCMGEKPCEIEIVSDQAINFGHTPFPTVNYEDPNLNVAYPIFSIHGNHDDPLGHGNHCSLDLLSAAGLVNYFGKYSSMEKIEMSPLLLKKGTSKMSIYGLGAMKDERLHRMFTKEDVTMLRPKEDQENWFNIFVIHQNRSAHGKTNFIPEQFLDDFLDLVFWGHEHECKIEPAMNPTQKFYVTQPGSSIATSLSEGETRDKHVGLLHVKGKEFRLEKIRLHTVRQFYMKDVVLSDTSLDPNDVDVSKKTEAYLTEQVKALLQRAARERTGNPRQPELPLIRIRVDYSGGFETFNQNRFAQAFVNKIANPKDLILFNRKKQMRERTNTNFGEMPELTIKSEDALNTARVEDMVHEFFAKVDQEQQMSLLSERGMGIAVKEFVEKDEKDAISGIVSLQLQKTQQYLVTRHAQEEYICEEVERYRDGRKQRKQQEEEQEVEEAISGHAKNTQDKTNDNGFDIESDDELKETVQARGRGRGRAKSTRGARYNKGSDNELDVEPSRGRGRGRARGTRGTRGSRGGRGAANARISDIFSQSNTSSSKHSARSSKSIFEEEPTVIDDSSDSDSQAGNKRKRNPPASSQYSRRKGTVFESDSEDDYVPQKKRR